MAMWEMKGREWHVGIFSLLIIIFSSCNSPVKEEKVSEIKMDENPPRQSVAVPEFNSDSAYHFIQCQSEMGPRTPGSKAHEKCVKYFQLLLEKDGAAVIVQRATYSTFDKKKWIGKNIIASFFPELPYRVLLCAHWDSRPFCDRDSIKANQRKACLGVNDGASGTGVLLEVARLLSGKNLKVGIDIIFLDMEDYGAGETDLGDGAIEDDWGLGAQYWSKNPHKQGYVAKYGVLLDMVGGEKTVFPLEGTSAFYAGQAQQKIWSTAGSLGYGNYFVQSKVGSITDDHVYINKWANIPCVDIIGYRESLDGFFPQHHTTDDVIKHIDKKTLKAVGQTLLELIFHETSSS